MSRSALLPSAWLLVPVCYCYCYLHHSCHFTSIAGRGLKHRPQVSLTRPSRRAPRMNDAPIDHQVKSIGSPLHLQLQLEWTPLDPESLCSAPCLMEQTLCQEPTNEDGIASLNPRTTARMPRMAKDPAYASAIWDAWRNDEAGSGTTWNTETTRVTYSCDPPSSSSDQSHPVTLHGHLIRSTRTTTPSKTNDHPLPGILFFPTAAGPHDVFLLYKAASLVNKLSTDGGGCFVLIADILSDSTGWGWRSDKSQYQTASRELLSKTDGNSEAEEGMRPVLQQRIRAAHTCLLEQPNVDPTRIAALGWCFGGHAILELGRMRIPGIRAMATFHGVFDDVAPSPSSSSTSQTETTSVVNGSPRDCEILLCHGTQDPFVSSNMVEHALQVFQDYRYTASLLQLVAKHGFTNPGQRHNPNPSFEYHPEAATKAWKQTMALLERRLVPKS